jgi:hypothetical protein
MYTLSFPKLSCIASAGVHPEKYKSLEERGGLLGFLSSEYDLGCVCVCVCGFMNALVPWSLLSE